MIRLRGRIVSGKGEGKKYVEIYRNVLRRKLGIDPYPGTLNIDVGYDVSKLYLSLKPVIIEPPTNNYKPVYAVPAEIGNIKGYVIKPFATVHGWNILEFIAEINVRHKLGLKDGDIVEVFLIKNPITRIML